jgi:hypothetical protein
LATTKRHHEKPPMQYSSNDVQINRDDNHQQDQTKISTFSLLAVRDCGLFRRNQYNGETAGQQSVCKRPLPIIISTKLDLYFTG